MCYSHSSMTGSQNSRYQKVSFGISAAVMVSLIIGACRHQPLAAGVSGEYNGTSLNMPAAAFRWIDQTSTAIALSDLESKRWS